MAKLIEFIWKRTTTSTNYNKLDYNCASNEITLEHATTYPNFCFTVRPRYGFLHIGVPLSDNKFDAGFIFDNGVRYMFNERNVDECKRLYYFLEHFIKTGETDYEEIPEVCNPEDIIF